MTKLPPPNREPVLAVCEFRPNTDEEPVCFTQRVFDIQRKELKTQVIKQNNDEKQ